jgi:mannose-1-phosphate guanylyltransferase
MPVRTHENRWALVLAGGDGTRLQGLTRRITGRPIPKQYCRIVGERSLLESTLERVSCVVPPRRILVVVNEDHLAIARDHLSAVPSENVLVQPCNRDTGPGLALALLHLRERDPNADVAVFPSDHFIRSLPGFVSSLAAMRRALGADPEKIVLLGIRPDRPDPGLGYIVPGASPVPSAADAVPVLRFEEKPTRPRATTIIGQGALWSSFIMLFRVERMLDVLWSTCADEMKGMAALVRSPETRRSRYPSLPAWNFSREVLARRTEDLVAVAAENLGWSDWGTPHAVLETVRDLGLRPPWLNAALAEAGA